MDLLLLLILLGVQPHRRGDFGELLEGVVGIEAGWGGGFLFHRGRGRGCGHSHRLLLVAEVQDGGIWKQIVKLIGGVFGLTA